MTNIVVVDDSKSNTFLLKHILEMEGFGVVEVNHGSVAISILPKEKPDLVILDVMMPEISGFDVLENMKANKITQDIPVLMYSAIAEQEIIEKALRQGACGYIYKPVSREKLIQTVNQFFHS